MFISVTLLYGDGKRLSAYAIRSQVPVAGWLHYSVTRFGMDQRQKVEAKLLCDAGQELLVLDHARLVASRGQQGALIEGVQYRKKGRKHSIADRQAWWCEAPPRTAPLLDKHARILAAQRDLERRIAAGWGPS